MSIGYSLDEELLCLALVPLLPQPKLLWPLCKHLLLSHQAFGREYQPPDSVILSVLCFKLCVPHLAACFLGEELWSRISMHSQWVSCAGLLVDGVHENVPDPVPHWVRASKCNHCEICKVCWCCTVLLLERDRYPEPLAEHMRMGQSQKRKKEASRWKTCHVMLTAKVDVGPCLLVCSAPHTLQRAQWLPLCTLIPLDWPYASLFRV